MTGKDIGYLWVAVVFFILLLDFLKYLKKSKGKIQAPPEEVAVFKRQEVESGKGSNTQKPNEAQPPPPPVKKKPAIVKPLVVHEGVLLKAGFAKREYGYSSFRLEIQSAELGASHEIWGIDLKRALEASGAKIGDRIRASLAGHVETSLNDGETTKAKKGIWDVTKLE